MDLDLPGPLIGQVIHDINPELAREWGGYFRHRTLEHERSTDWLVAIETLRKLSRRCVVADVGCGPGTFLLYLRRLKFQSLIGSDVKVRNLHAASVLHRRFDLGAGVPRWLRGSGASTIQALEVDAVTAFDWLYEEEHFLPEFLLTAPGRLAIISVSPPTAPVKLSRVHRTEPEIRRLAQECGWWTGSVHKDGDRGRVTYVFHKKASI